MKKKVKKLVLNRETLGNLKGVVGGALTLSPRCQSSPCGPTGPGDTGGGDLTIFATCGACSAGCATGGACTVTCGACSDAC